MLSVEDAVEIAGVLFQRQVDRQEIASLLSHRGFSNRTEFRAYLIETEEFKANYPDVYYALVAATSERIAKSQIAHHISGMQDEIEALRRLNALQEGEIVRLAGELDRFINTCRSNGERLADLERSVSHAIAALRKVR
jgi:hypothetical protein